MSDTNFHHHRADSGRLRFLADVQALQGGISFWNPI
jgi:hypothetical protein